ncbi:MAG TPA: UDP-N-acetyl glucosamine 2-epimerase [Vicinamibacterales bacterium]|nr:UDP-N-acetyl glucosamine 2-epimerase [Vicinamibacterales bacterium]
MTTILTVVGARPQFVKASAVSCAIRRRARWREVVVHTGQHFEDQMSGAFFRELSLAPPDYNLGVAGGGHGEMTGRMLERLEPVIQRESPAAVLVYGDTNSTLAGALAAVKLHVPVVHVEAGLRSRNRSMPEEVNRIVTDHISTLLCCPTRTAVDNLVGEGFVQVLDGGALADVGRTRRLSGGAAVANVGDVMLDVLLRYRQTAADTSRVLDRLGLAPRRYGVLTIHRADNTARAETLAALLTAVGGIARSLPIVFVMHPRTRELLDQAGRDSVPGIEAVDPLPYLDFLNLQANAAVIVTDSGGVQKEACFLGVPCVTLRSETEWPETIAAGANVLAGSSPGMLSTGIIPTSDLTARTTDAFGRGDAAARIVALIETLVGE